MAASPSRRAARWVLRIRAVGSSYWFLPAMMAVGAIALSVLLLFIDRTVVGSGHVALLYEGDAAGARAVLGTIAGSMITVAGVVFSITVVALSLASQQFGPMLLRNFMHDRSNQGVLGTFVATFLYCLLVLRAVRGGEPGFVPQASVTTALGLAVVSLGVLIFFIHHIATSIRPEGLLERVASDLDRATRSLYPERVGAAAEEVVDPTVRRELEDGLVLSAPGDGYVEVIEDHSLVEVAREHDLVVETLVAPGEFVVTGSPIARVHPAAACDDATREALLGRIVLGGGRNGDDRVQHGFDELVQLCLRALSPSLNDPLTARVTLDRMTAALAAIARRSMPPERRFDEEGALRVVARRPGFDDLVRRVFDPVRQNAGRQTEVFGHLLRCIDQLRPSLRDDEQRRSLRELVLRIESTAREDLSPADADHVLPRAKALAADLGARSNGDGAGGATLAAPGRR